MTKLLHAAALAAIFGIVAGGSTQAQTPPVPVVDLPATTVPRYVPAAPLGSATPSYGIPTTNVAPPNYAAPPAYGPSSVQGAAPLPSRPAVSGLPGYGGPMYGGPGPYAGGQMPTGSFDRQNFSPNCPQTPPPPRSQWVSTYSLPLGAKFSARGGSPEPGNAPPCGAYGAYGPSAGNAECNRCNDCGPYNPCENWFDNIAFISAIDAFRGPLDLDAHNANFGKRFGIAGAVPLSKAWGVGLQFSSSVAWYDWMGSQFTGDKVRFQNFSTLGAFQRLCCGLGYGVVYDWLYDDYYSKMNFSQFRAAVSWQYGCHGEIGVWGAMPYRKDATSIGNPAVLNNFQPVMQASGYWRHIWTDCAVTTTYVGIAESPSMIPFGTSAQVAINDYVAVVGNYEYILPRTHGAVGRRDEIWNVGVGFAFYPGSARRVARSQFRPLLPPANNGNFGIWRH